MEELIRLINDVIEQAITHGEGGACDSNKDNLLLCINNLLKYMKVENQYEIKVDGEGYMTIEKKEGH